MDCCSAEKSDRGHTDLVRSPLRWIVWGIPAVLFLVGLAWSTGRVWLWVPSLAVAGLACVANASRCGRQHCFVTGPVFLLGAAATLASATGVVALDWRVVLAAVMAGTASGYGLEWLRGKYVGGRPAEEGSKS